MKLNLSFLAVVITLAIFTSVTYLACNKDDCKGISCLNGGSCADGKCVCPDGYTGANCEIKKDPCENITCLNGGTCENGVCKCPPGYEGPRCENKVDSCMYIICLNGGTCIDGKCYCPKGYEGKNCETKSKDKFKGVWTVMENGTITPAAQYSIAINDGASITNMVIINFYNKLTSPLDIAISNDSLFIPQQIVGDHELKGWGVMNAAHDKIIVHYNIKDLTTSQTDEFGLNIGEPSVWTK